METQKNLQKSLVCVCVCEFHLGLKYRIMKLRCAFEYSQTIPFKTNVSSQESRLQGSTWNRYGAYHI